MAQQPKKDALHSSLKLLVRTSIIVFVGILISKILGYVYRIIIARHFGPEVYGLFTLALTIASFFITIASFGLLDGILRFTPLLRAKGKIEEIKHTFRRLQLILVITAIISSIILFVMSRFIAVKVFHNPELLVLLRIFILWIPINMLTSIYLAYLRAFEEISIYSFIFNIFQNIARVVVISIFIFIEINSNASPIVRGYIIAGLFTLILSYFTCRYKINKIFGNCLKKDYSKLDREFFNYSWPVMFYGIIGMILYWIDSFSLGFYKSAVEVGFYNAAVPIALLISIIPEVFMQLFFPLINREYSGKNYKLIQQLSKQVTKWTFMAVLPIFILMFLFPGAALNILFGADYLPAENALRILLIASFISALFVVSNNLLSMLGKSKIILMDITFAAMVNLLLNSLLVPRTSLFSIDNSNGLVGAALATLISITFLNMLFMFQTKKYLSFIPLRRKMITIFIISIIPTAILLYLKNILPLTISSIIILSALFVLIYGTLLIISKSLDENDWMIIRAVWRKIVNF